MDRDVLAAGLVASLNDLRDSPDELASVCRELISLKGGLPAAVVAAAPALAAQMLRHVPCARLQRNGCFTFVKLAEQGDAGRSAVLAAGAIGLAIAAVRAHADDVQMSFIAANLLCELASGSAQHSRAVVDAGGIPALVAWMTAFPEDPNLQDWGAKALRLIVHHDVDHATLAASQGANEVVLAAMRAGIRPHNRQDEGWNTVLASACVFLSESSFRPVNQARAIDGGALELLVKVLQHARAEVAQVACQAVANLMFGADEQVNRRSPALIGQITVAIVAAMRANRGDAPLQDGGCYALSTIELEHADVLCATPGAVAAVVGAMRSHADDASLQQHGGEVLGLVCKSRDESSRMAVELGAIEAVVNGMRATPGNVDLQKVACITLANVVGEIPEHRTAAGAAGAVQAVVAVLHKHNHEPRLQLGSCLALTRMLSGNADNGTAAVDAGALELLVNVIRASQHVDDEELRSRIYVRACCALDMLCREGHDPAAHLARATRAGAGEAVMTHRRPCADDDFGEPDLTRLVVRLASAAALHNVAACSHAACARCRQAGTLCGLQGCGARARTDGRKMQRCGACRTTAYCCVEHQRADWARHKAAECRAAAPAAGGAQA